MKKIKITLFLFTLFLIPQIKCTTESVYPEPPTTPTSTPSHEGLVTEGQVYPEPSTPLEDVSHENLVTVGQPTKSVYPQPSKPLGDESYGELITIDVPQIGKVELKKDLDPNKLPDLLKYAKNKIEEDNFKKNKQLDKTIKFNNLDVNQAELAYSKENNEILIVGNSTLFGIPIITSLSAKKTNNKWSDYSFNAQIEKDHINLFDIFKNKAVRKLGNIKIKQVKIEYNQTQKSFYFIGEAKIFGTNTSVKFFKINSPNAKGFYLEAKVDPTWKFSDAFPTLKKTFFDDFQYKDINFLLSDITYKNKESGINAEIGIFFDAIVKVGKQFKILKKLITVDINEIELYGELGTNASDIGLSASIPGLIKFPKGSPFDSAGLTLSIEAVPPTIMLYTDITLKKSKYNPELKFESGVAIGLDGASISGNMTAINGEKTSVWKNALKIKGFDIYNLTIAGHTTGIIGIAGKFNINHTTIEIALDPDELILLGKIKNLDIKNILNFSTKIIPNAQMDFNYIDLKIKEGTIYAVSPLGGSIGTTSYPPGITINADVEFAKKYNGKINIELSLDKGFTAEGTLNKIVKIGKILTIDGKGLDKKAGTKDDGPAFSIKATQLEKEFYITGIIKILGLSNKVNIFINKDGYSFNTTGKIYNLFESDIEAEANFSKKPYFNVKATLKNDFYDFVEKNVTRNIDKLKKNVISKIENAETEVKKLDKILENREKKIKKKKEEIKKQEKKYNAKKWNDPKRAAIKIKITKLTAEREGLKAQQTSTRLAKKIALSTLKALKKNINFRFETAKIISSFASGKYIRVENAYFEDKLSDFEKLRLTRLKMNLVFLGHTLNLDIMFDLKDPKGNIKHIVNAIMQQI